MYEVLRFEPVYKDYIWGGRRLADYGKVLPADGRVAESWELSCQANGLSIVDHGRHAGQILDALVRRDPVGMLGARLAAETGGDFPMLIKLIDAQGDLSVQVHPDDRAARRLEGVPYGKNEIWYVLHAPPGARLIAGLREGVTREELEACIAEGRTLDALQQVEVVAGDVINIPAGLVHAITAGLIIYEVQQSSDTTYRLYDYGRLGADGAPRPLHIEQALEVIDFEAAAGGAARPFAGYLRPAHAEDLAVESGELSRRLLVLNRYFSVERQALAGRARWSGDTDQFRILTVLEGELALRWGEDEAAQSLALERGRTVFVPAALGALEMEGEATLLVSWAGDRPLRDVLFQAVEPEALAALVALDPPFAD